jgi:LemA protein
VKTALIIILILVVVGVAGGGKFVSVRNDLVNKREAINAQWSQVDVVLQRRADLIPNLVETVKAFAKHETEVFTNIANARAALAGARNPQEKIAANDQLSGTENRISVERRKYNEVLQHYNAQIQRFPDNIVASMSGFTRNDAYFSTEPGARQAPKVQF